MADTIVMIHGMWGGSWYWERYKKFFESKGYTCITPVLRYHNVDPESKPPEELGTTSLLDYADDLEKVIKELPANPILMGHSMGGLLSQMLAGRGLAKAIILLTPASPAGILALRPSVIKSFWSGMMRWGFWRKPMKQTFEEAVYSMMHLLPPEEQKSSYKRFVYESGRAAFEIGFWLFDRKKAARVDENRVKCPVLVIAGKEDRITPASVVKRVAEKYGSVSTYKEFEHHAHWVVGEPGWEDVANYVYEWLKEHT
ncbi:MAG: alpha/beta hydrolase [bacterium]